MSTPRFVLEAVKAFRERDDREPLKAMFCNGIALHEYEESRELMLDLMDGKKPRTRGQKLTDTLSQAKEFGAVMEAATLHGAGMTLYYLSKDAHKITASMIAAERLDCTDEHFYKRIWPKYQGLPETERQMEFGKRFREYVLQDI